MERRIGKYLVERALGAGSFATVWLAHDELLDDRVAIKVLAENWARNDDVRRRFVDEAKILRRIDHTSVIRVLVIDETEDERPYFVMSWADRGTLRDRLASRRDTDEVSSVPEAIGIATDILEALNVVHDYGVVHRDIKPSNVLFRSVSSHERNAAQRSGQTVGDEMVLLGDFGLAKDLAGASGFTQAAGTPAYMAPEQSHTSSVIDHRADIYSTTALLYELLAGKTPFAADTLSAVRRGRSNHHVDALQEIRKGLPDSLLTIVERGLSIDPEGRPSGPEMVALLQSVDPDATSWSSGAAPLVPTGAEGRALDVIERSRAALPAEEQLHLVLDRAEGALRRPLTVWGPEDDPADAAVADIIVDADAPVGVELPGAGPVAVLVAPDYSPPEIDRIVDMLAGDRLMAIRAGRSLAIARAGLGSVAGDRRGVAIDLLRDVEELERELPGLAEFAVLREEAVGRAMLPRPLRFEFRRLLLEVEPHRRLGLTSAATDEEIEMATVSVLDRWRGLVNDGRVPFTGRPLADQLIRSLERLWSNVSER